MYLVFLSTKVLSNESIKQAFAARFTSREKAERARALGENHIIVAIEENEAISTTIENSPGAQVSIGRGNIQIGGNVAPGSVVGSGNVSARNISGGNITINGKRVDDDLEIDGYYIFGKFRHTNDMEDAYATKKTGREAALRLARHLLGVVVWFEDEEIQVES